MFTHVQTSKLIKQKATKQEIPNIPSLKPLKSQ